MKYFLFGFLCLSILVTIFLYLIKFPNPYTSIDHQNQINQFGNIVSEEKRKSEDIKLPIVLYHYVETVSYKRDTIRQGLAISPQIFESQLVTLLSHQYHPILLKDLNNYFNLGIPLPHQPIILTFDDGYRDFYTDVFPILQKYHVPAIIFIVTGFLDSTRNYLTTEQLKELNQSELIEIGSHSVTHSNFNQLDLLAIKDEIYQSKYKLEHLIGKPVEYFAYPYGAYYPSVADELAKVGYNFGLTIEKGTQQNYQARFLLKRIKPGAFTGESFLALFQ